jgi:hypothetical protein
MSVLPERGMPMMNTGTSVGSPCPAFMRISSEVKGLIVDDSLPHQTVAFEQVTEGLLVTSEIRVGFAEPEMQHELLSGRQPVRIAGEGLHRSELRVIGGKALQVAEELVKPGRARIARDRILKRRPRFIETPERRQCLAEIGICRREIRLQGNGPLDARERLVEAPQSKQCEAEISVRLGIVRSNRDRAPSRDRRLFIAVEHAKSHREAVMGFRRRWSLLDRPGQNSSRLAVAVHLDI